MKNTLYKYSFAFVISVFGTSSFAVEEGNSIGWYRTDDPMKVIEVAGQFGDCHQYDSSKSLTLLMAADIALCNNPKTQEVYANAKAQAAQIGIAKSEFFPTVINSSGINTNLNDPSSTSRGASFQNWNNQLSINYLLYDFGNRAANLENAKLLLLAVSRTQDSTVQSVLLATIKAYFQTLADIASLEANKKAEEFYYESFKAAEAKYKAGVSTPADKLQAQTAFAQAKLNTISAEGALQNSYGVLANVMGLNADANIKIANATEEIADANISSGVASLIEAAQYRRPDLLASEAQMAAAKQVILAREAASKPTVSLGFSNTWQGGSRLDGSNATSLGITVSIPIFQGFLPTYQVEYARALYAGQQAKLMQLRQQVSLEVWTAFYNLKTANESVLAVEVLLVSAKESSSLALGRYKAGVGNIIDALNAQNALASAEQQYIKVKTQRNIARATLAQAIGILDYAMVAIPKGND
ncbi:MAG TPA: TolC family protein [Methylophilus sp.]|nr:TolC family protein [Methylophilus sp.]